MSKLIPIKQQIAVAKPHFDKLDNLNFSVEANFAMQSLVSNDYLMKVATGNLDSLKDSMLNVASIGLSLNPALSHAYLIPRGGEVCLDISYQGIISLATKNGALDCVTAELFCEGEEFLLQCDKAPIHSFNPFTRSQHILGVYCVSYLPSGHVITTTMSVDELNEIKKLSLGASKPSSPWNKFFGEMAKKCVIKRASKLWPSKDISNEALSAVHFLNNEGGQGITNETPALDVEKTITPSQDNIELTPSNGTQEEQVQCASLKKSLSLSKQRIDVLCSKAIEGNKIEAAIGYFKDNIQDVGQLEYALGQFDGL